MDIDKFKSTLEGWTVIDVSASKKGEYRWKMNLRRGSQVREVHFGSDVRGHTHLGHVTNGESMFDSFEDLVLSLQDHIASLCLDRESEHEMYTTLEVLEDVKNQRLGFQCPVTKVDFWSHVGNIKDSPFKARMQTKDGRAKMASDLWNMQGGLW